jgi:hypothetical protein
MNQIFRSFPVMAHQHLFRVLVLLTLVGCESSNSIPMQLTRNQSALDYYAWLTQATPVAIASERALLQESPATSRPLEDQVRLALILGIQDNPEDRQQAQQLLAAVSANPPLLLPLQDEYRILGQLWSRYLLMQDQLAAQTSRQQALTTELQQQRQDYEQLLLQILQQDEVLATMQQNSRLLEDHNILLQQQLEALTEIEEELMDRGQAGNGEE